MEEKEPVPLSIHHIPVCVSFGFFDNGYSFFLFEPNLSRNIIIVDPNLKEEAIMDGRMTMTLNSHREICAVQKGGGTPISSEQIIHCSRIAAVKVEEITQLIKSSLTQITQQAKKEKRK